MREGSSIQTFPARSHTRATPVVKEQPRCRGQGNAAGKQIPGGAGLLPVAFGAALIAAGTRAALAGRVSDAQALPYLGIGYARPEFAEFSQ